MLGKLRFHTIAHVEELVDDDNALERDLLEELALIAPSGCAVVVVVGTEPYSVAQLEMRCGEHRLQLAKLGVSNTYPVQASLLLRQTNNYLGC